MSHVEKLRNVQEKEKKELQEFRKILNKIGWTTIGKKQHLNKVFIFIPTWLVGWLVDLVALSVIIT